MAAKYECYHFHFHLPCTLPTSYFKFKLYFKHLRKGHILIVGFLFQPAAWVASQVEATNLVVHEDGQAEWQSWEPPHESTEESGKVSERSATRRAHRDLTRCRTYFNGYMRRPLSMPGVYDRMAANTVSKMRPKFKAQFLIPWWKMELRRVLQMMISAHCTTTIDMKKAVWQVNSNVLRSL